VICTPVTRQGLAQVLVGEVADVLGGDRVDDLRRVALEFERVAQAGANTGDDDLVDGLGLLAVGRLRVVRHGGDGSEQATGSDRTDLARHARAQLSKIEMRHLNPPRLFDGRWKRPVPEFALE
jgi:hypothetical protein